jgi:hypothetical protein
MRELMGSHRSAKFQPYAALRQKFWRQFLNQYDTDDTATLSRLELTSMLDSLGSTLTPETIGEPSSSRASSSKNLIIFSFSELLDPV